MRFLTVLLSVFSSFVLVALRAEEARLADPLPPKVFVLNSYAQGYAWSDDELAGLVEVLSAHHVDIEPVIIHLDARRFNLAEREPLLLEELRYKVEREKPKLLITLDDAAFQFAAKHRALFGLTTPWVFGGVNRFDPAMIEGQHTVTGVAEESSFQETFQLISALCPSAKKLLVVASQSTTGDASLESFKRHAATQQVPWAVEYYRDWTNAQLLERVARLPDDTVGLLLETTVDAAGVQNYSNLPFNEALASRTRRPLFMNSFPPGRRDWAKEKWGGLGGGLVLPIIHGRKVGEMAVRILKGESADKIPVLTETPVLSAVDYRHLLRLHLDVSRLPKDTVIFNQPSSFYQIHKSSLIWTLVLLGILAGAVLILSINILQRRRAEQALGKARAELELLAKGIAQSNDLILILTLEARLLYANAAFETLCGIAPRAWMRRALVALMPLSSKDKSFEQIFEHLRTQGTWSGVIEPTLPEGHAFKLQSRLVKVASSSDHEEPVILFIGRDVTREAQLEEQLRSAQKMEAVGLLAGGIAHDFNNILQVINGHLALLLEEAWPETQLQDLQIVSDAGVRAAQLTKQLLVFSRRQPMNRDYVDPSQLVADMLRMLKRLIGAHIDVQFQPVDSPMHLYADKGQLEQVLLNLCLNSRDAMPAGGRLCIELARVVFSPEDCEASTGLQAGPYLELRVKDTGTGIPKDALPRIFEPFFSTKELGKGTGLGLSVAYGIVQNHQGMIRVYSEPGIGTVFKVYLPEYQSDVTAAIESALPSVPSGVGTILLAEDEAPVQLLATRILTRNGFTVITANDGVHALELLRERHSEITLVMLDVMMPKMSGRQVYDHLKIEFPQIPVLFCSGYSADMLPPDMAPDAGFVLIEKPYEAAELLLAINKLLTA